MRDGILRVFVFFVSGRYALGAGSLFFDECQINRTAQRCGRCDAKRPINLPRVLVLELARQCRRRPRGTRQHDDTACVTVKTMDKLGAFIGIEL